MNGRHYIGKRVSSFEVYNDVGPITGIALVVDSDNEYLAGDQNGYVLEVQCPYGTQAMANNILAGISGHVYRGYRAENAILAPSAELGDSVTVNGVYSMLAYRKVNFGPGHMSEIAAPGEDDVDHEYPYVSSMQRKINRQIAETRSLITKTAEQIRLEVANEVEGLSSSFTVELDKVSTQIESELDELSTSFTVSLNEVSAKLEDEINGLSASFTVSLDSINAEVVGTRNAISSIELSLDSITERIQDAEGNMSELELTTSSIAARVEDAEGNYASLEEYVDSLTLSVSNGSTSSTIKLMSGSTEIASQNITMSGLVTYTGLADGTTTINGGCIQTGLIEAEYLNLTGAISWGSLSSSMQGIVDDIESTANGAYNMADSAYDMALDTGDIVSDWSYVYRGTTYIDGTRLMTGTVTATMLQGGTVAILDASGDSVANMYIETTTSTGLTIESDYALRLLSAGNLYLESSNASLLMSGRGIEVDCGWLVPVGEAAYLGYSGRGMWEAVYAYTGTIQTSDLNQKNSVIYGLESYDKFFDLLAAISFLFNTGTSGRRHFGLGAQDVEQALVDAGLTSMDFAGLIKSPRLDDEGQEIEGEYDYALRYAEFIPLLIDQVQKLKNRVNELEAAAL